MNRRKDRSGLYEFTADETVKLMCDTSITSDVDDNDVFVDNNNDNEASSDDCMILPSDRKQLYTDEKATKDEDSLPLWRKLCFAVGGAPYQITSTVIGFFLNLFLLEVALLKPRYVSIILFSGKAWDAITDPSIGILVQKTNTRWGKMRPWILFSAPFACACYFMLFYVPWGVSKDAEDNEHIDASDGSKFGFYFAMFCLFEGFLTCLHVPYTSLTMYITTKQKDRDLVTVIRMGFEAGGVLIAVIVQGIFVSNTRCKGDEVLNNSTSIEVQKQAYVHGSLVVISIYIVCCLIVFFGSKEKKGIFDEMTENQVGFFQGIKLVFTYKPYIWASLTFVLWTIGIQVVQGNIALYCTHVLKRGDEFSKFILTLLIVSIASMPIWYLAAQKFGKKTVYAAGIMLMIPVFISQYYIPADTPVWVYYIIMVVAGFGISVALLLPWSILPDILDLYMLEKKSRHDAIFYSLYVFFNKLAGGLALAASQVALDYGGYVNGECKQPESVEQTLRLLMTPGPTVLTLISLGTLYMYPIDENKRKWIRETMTSMSIDYGGYVNGECKQPESVEQTLRLLMTPGPTVLTLISLGTLYMYPIDENKRKWIRETMTSMSIEVEKVSITASTKSYDSIKTENVTHM